MKPLFSICIPNYNYGDYIGETIESVLNQTFQDFEICISDNASTDNSWEVIKSYASKNNKIKIARNMYNVGFAGNLDKVSALTEGRWHIMLSSDDLMEPNVLELYERIIRENNYNERILINSGFTQFNNKNPEVKFSLGYNKFVWQNHQKLKPIDNIEVISDKTDNLLRHGFEKFVSPFYFVALCYSKQLYDDVNGYGNIRMMNPDKWFHWNLCTVAEKAIFINFPLFKYRWHDNNQTANQNKSGILKFWLDEYRNCFELNDKHFTKSGYKRETIENLFFKNTIISYGYASIAYGLPLKALRIIAFGVFTYPHIFFRSIKAIVLLISMTLYPLTWVISKVSKYFRRFK
jgi:glycosyltransferase involved in cell wall biosynthesis